MRSLLHTITLIRMLLAVAPAHPATFFDPPSQPMEIHVWHVKGLQLPKGLHTFVVTRLSLAVGADARTVCGAVIPRCAITATSFVTVPPRVLQRRIYCHPRGGKINLSRTALGTTLVEWRFGPRLLLYMLPTH